MTRGELRKQPIPQQVTDCVVEQVGKPPYDAIRRIFAGANAAAVLADALRRCLEPGSA